MKSYKCKLCGGDCGPVCKTFAKAPERLERLSSERLVTLGTPLPPSHPFKKPGFDRKAYQREYLRAYMKKRRARARKPDDDPNVDDAGHLPEWYKP